MFRVGFSQMGSKNWMGGHTYLKNISSVIKARLKDKILLKFITYDKENLENVDLKKFDKILKIKNKITFLNKIINFIYNSKLNKIINSELDIFFDVNHSSIFTNSKKIVPWIPDFQHRHLPNFFTFFGYWKRELLFKKKIFFQKNIIVSSNHAKKDCIKFYNKDPNQIHVVKFSIFTDPKNHINKISYLKKKYKIEKKYIYVPNQFWAHKNHNVILKSLKYIKSINLEIYNKIPQIIFTGIPFDNRNKEYSKKVLVKINSSKFKNKVRYLGVVPLDDVYKLNANCLCLINPSYFEGWSTTVEEAKSFGTPTILSNIPVHKEQLPKSIFFNPYRYKELSAVLIDIVKKKYLLVRKKGKKVIRENNKRNFEHADQFLNAIKKSINF